MTSSSDYSATPGAGEARSLVHWLMAEIDISKRWPYPRNGGVGESYRQDVCVVFLKRLIVKEELQKINERVTAIEEDLVALMEDIGVIKAEQKAQNRRLDRLESHVGIAA